MAAEEAAQRIQAVVKPDSAWNSFLPMSGGLVGWVSGTRCQLTARIPLMRNSFDSVLDGQFVPAPNGCRLLASLHPRTFAVAFLAVWLGITGIIGSAITISVVVDPRDPSPPPFFFGLIFPAFGIALGALMRWMAGFQERRLLRQLDQAFGVPA